MVPLNPLISALPWLLLALTSSSAPLTSSSRSASIPTSTSSSGSSATTLGNTNIFSQLLLIDLLDAAAPPYINLKPTLPEIPNVFVPMTKHSEQDPDKPKPGLTGGHQSAPPTVTMPSNFGQEVGDEEYNAESSNPQERPQMTIGEIIIRCMGNRTPTLPSTFGPEVGVVRLFTEPSFRVEVAILKGCGCMGLTEPRKIDSFVGTRNHSFAFYETERCQGEPYFQRFQSSHAMHVANTKKSAKSLKIVHGVLPPLP
ncbi:hypothetical protein EMPS_06013 [Entomortierella parvispora]|uniref:Uncharacterized protein n=1 Tax=Entomortierella parvispora TaxID=205924 RepID=A0A9P3HBU4_9FUNG|nr:hypothetical protein EMPS_06013 [Entomortierella parvispora]